MVVRCVFRHGVIDGGVNDLGAVPYDSYGDFDSTLG